MVSKNGNGKIKMIYLCAVATNQELFEVLIFKTLGTKLNYNVKLFGLGKKWEGFKTKINEFYNGLSSFDDEDLVICSDAYDVLPLRYAEDFLLNVQRILDMGVHVMASAELYCLQNCKTIQDWHKRSSFSVKSNLKYVNAGLVFGKAKFLRQMYKSFLSEEDDQLALSSYFNQNPQITFLDQTNEFFQTCASNKYVPRLNQLSKESFQGKGTFFAHVPSLNFHLVQRLYYKEILESIAKRVNIEHLTGIQTKVSWLQKIELYLVPILIAIIIFLINKKWII